MRKTLLKYAVLISSFIVAASAGGTDACGEVNGFLQVPNQFFPGQTVNAGLISACLCVSGIPSFIALNPAAINGISFAGKAAVTQALTNMITGGKNYGTCYYPDHSSPQCQFGNPCGFTCTDGYTPYPSYGPATDCVCSAPYIVCNGKCTLSSACPSYGYSRRSMTGSPDLRCPAGLEACPIMGRSSLSWECVNTKEDLESCGGCIITSSNNYNSRSKKEGVDCTAIQGVSDVSCITGQCVVDRCMPGYSVNASGDSCVPVSFNKPAAAGSGFLAQD
ncbi:hypothetical protein CPC08DRAFT_820776 [Agrocybe pediades]|nr:hypothetical protein CPC08DRAFT_820776 [Agrocybe pediades]